MKIKLGLYLDGQRFAPARHALGEATVGPLGLLDILETQLGLTCLAATESERIMAYHARLQACDRPSRFYHRTFDTDALGTAATLLEWRDTWILHGWDGSAGAATCPRIVDMAEVEQATAVELSPGIGERLAALHAALARRRAAVSSLVLLDPLEAFPKRWRELLAMLPNVEDCTPLAPGSGEGGTFLDRLQGALANAPMDGGVPVALRWVDDGSVLVMRAETALESARWLAERMREIAGGGLLVCGGEGPLLDAVLSGADMARQGARDVSLLRPAMQLLPLVLESMWAPVDVHGLLQFLLHPDCPLHPFIRRSLAEALADRPGIGGPRWDRAMAIIAEWANAKWPEVAGQIAMWVAQPQFSRDAAAPIATFIEPIKLLGGEFTIRALRSGGSQSDRYMSAVAQCENLTDALCDLLDQGIETIRRRQLQTLVEQASAGSTNPANFAELGAIQNVSQPGAAVEDADTVFWWHLAMPSMPVAYPWSASELALLSCCGVDLPPMDKVLATHARGWLRPVLAARKALVLVLPPGATEVHPLWQTIEAICPALPVVALGATLAAGGIAMAPVPHVPLQIPRRWWTLPPGTTLPEMSETSFSELELVLFNPFHWLLKYPAKLRPSRILAVPDDMRLNGNLAHALAERLFRAEAPLAMDGNAFEQWFDAAFDRLLVEEGAVLLMPGRRAECASLRVQLHRALNDLRRHFSRADVQLVQPEHAVEGSFAGGALAGTADLIVSDAQGRRAVVDMKWAGDKIYPAKLLANGHLQLVMYAELLRQQENARPAVAYFIVSKSRLLAGDTLYFSDATAVPPKSGENHAQVWQRFLTTWHWRQAQFGAGQFELVLDAIDTDADSAGPEDGLFLETLNPRYNDFLSLGGWKD